MIAALLLSASLALLLVGIMATYDAFEDAHTRTRIIASALLAVVAFAGGGALAITGTLSLDYTVVVTPIAGAGKA